MVQALVAQGGGSSEKGRKRETRTVTEYAVEVVIAFAFGQFVLGGRIFVP